MARCAQVQSMELSILASAMGHLRQQPSFGHGLSLLTILVRDLVKL